MRRRDLIKGIAGSAAVWPLAAPAQQPAMPVIGYLGGGSAKLYAELLRGLRQGLTEIGYVEGQNVAIEYRWAEGQNDRLPVLATDLVRRKLAVSVAGDTPSTLALKSATSTIPIVFYTAVDPVALGLVASLNRPGGNLTGITNLTLEVGPKSLQLLHELLPAASTFALLVNPTSSTLAEAQSRDSLEAARTLGLQLHVLRASTDSELDSVFATLAKLRVGGLVIGSDSFFFTRSAHIAALAAQNAVPAIFGFRKFSVDGGLMSYGSDIVDGYRQVGIYTGRVLNGEKPADLPVQQSTKVELIINMRTAKALGITVPISLLGRADEVIE
jgi:putative ABC transport system substrate-binding protein